MKRHELFVPAVREYGYTEDPDPSKLRFYTILDVVF